MDKVVVSQDLWVIKMSLNNIQRSKQKVLNRPMFAKMKDGTIKPVQYLWYGAALNIGSKALPYIGRGLAATKNTLPSIITKGKNLITRGGSKVTGGGTGTAVGPYLGGGPGLPAVIAKGSKIFRPTIKNILTTGGSLLGYKTLSDWMGESKDIEDDSYKGSGTEEKPKNSPGQKIKKKKSKTELDVLDKEIKKGTLDDLIKDRIGIFEKYLGDGKDQVKAGGFAALTEFGLNLASARGGNFMDKIARSAKDPVKTFTAIGMAAKDRADKIKMAGVEAGIKAEQAALDRAAEADPEGTTFQRNLSTLTTMFTGADGNLTIDQEDLVNMAKAGGTTSRKEFLSTVVPSLVTKQDINTGEPYTVEKATEIAEAVWAQISGQGGSQKEMVEEKKEVISLD